MRNLFIAYLSFLFNLFYCSSKPIQYLGFGLGMGRSSSYGDGSLLFLYNINRKFEAKIGIGRAEYRGFSYGLDINFSPLLNSKIVQPIVGLNYMKHPSRTYSYGTDDNHISTYHFLAQEYFVVMVGAKTEINFRPEKELSQFLSIRFFVSYRYSDNNRGVVRINGNAPMSLDDKINKRITENFGLSLQLLLLISPKSLKKGSMNGSVVK